MKVADFEHLEDQLMNEIVTRRKLGDYNADSPSIRYCLESLYKLTQHMHEMERAIVVARRKAAIARQAAEDDADKAATVASADE
jgi:hypothetical protein